MWRWQWKILFKRWQVHLPPRQPPTFLHVSTQLMTLACPNVLTVLHRLVHVCFRNALTFFSSLQLHAFSQRPTLRDLHRFDLPTINSGQGYSHLLWVCHDLHHSGSCILLHYQKEVSNCGLWWHTFNAEPKKLLVFRRVVMQTLKSFL